jgi:pimeloyl-ACP methyl ester carboxylesterase
MTPKITEQAVLFGEKTALVGILARMAAEPADRPAIVILNTGLIHRVGYNRMFVGMSRAFAVAGYRVLRFDFSGIGDSDPRNEALRPLDSCMADIRDALDWLEKTHGASRFILVGLCSGADHAVQYGHTDPRVAALVLLDPTLPITARHFAHYILIRLAEPRTWIRFVSGRSSLIAMGWRQMQRLPQKLLRPRREPHPDIASGPGLDYHYERSVQGGIAMLAAFTGESTRQTYREQMLDAFPHVQFGNKLQIEFFPDSDHVFSRETDRSELTRLILGWVDALSRLASCVRETDRSAI